MQRNALRLIALGCLVALAGCVGGLPGGEQTLDDVSYPAGVSDNGTDVTALSEAHNDALENQSFNLEVGSTVNSSEENQSVRIDAAVGPDRDNVRVNASAADQNVSMYLTSEQQYTRIGTGDDSVYQSSERTPDAMNLVPSSYSGASYVSQFTGMANVTPTDVREVDGTTLIVLEADGSNATANESANVVDYDATMLVDEQGVVHSMTVEASSENAGQQIDTRFSMELSDVGETTVDEPAWLDEARDQANE